MGLEISGKITLFAKIKESNGGKFAVFTTSLTRDFGESGKRISKTLQVFFSKKRYPQEWLLENFEEDFCYTIKIKNGFIAPRSYFNGKGDEVIELCANILDFEILTITAVDVEKREIARTITGIQKNAPEKTASPLSDKIEPSDPINVIDDDLPF